MTAFASSQRPASESLAHAARLLETLHREHDALLRNELLVLEEIAATKQQQLAELDQVQHRVTPAESDEWRALIGQCQTQNMANGVLIRLRREHIELLMRLLHGQAPGVALYDASGAAAESMERNSLGRV